MADKKISQLTNLTGANLADNDEFVLVDTSVNETKAITWSELKEGLDTGTGFVRITGDTMTGDLSFGDNDKAIFGAGSDLQIYHDGSNSWISEAGTGALVIQSSQINLNKYTGENMIVANADGAVTLYHDNAAKLATTSTGIDVTGTVTADGLTVDGAATITDTGNVIGSNAPLLIKSNNGAATTSYGWDNLTSNYDYAFKTNGSERMRIDSSGRVGIGTSSPANTLTIKGGAHQLDIETDGSGVTIESIDRSVTSDPSDISYYARNGSHKFFNGQYTERMRIDSSGNVGIGTPTTGPYRFNSLRADGNVAFFTDGATADLFIKTTAGVSTISPTTGVLALGTSSTERMRIDASGNVGIGTTSVTPYANLVTTGIGGSQGGVLDFHASAVGTGFNRVAQIYGGNGGFLSFGTGASDSISEAMRIDASGNVGIGTDLPSDTLSVVNLGSSGTGTQISSGTSSGDLRFKARTESYNGIVSVYDSGSNEDVRISAHSGVSTYFNSGSNVGIGTSSPLAALSVGGGSLSDTNLPIQISTGASGNRYVGINKNGAYALLVGYEATADQAEIRNIQNTPIVFKTNDAERMRIDASGRVGIGESNPDTSLDVVGGSADSVVDTLTLKNDSTGSSAGVGLNFVVDGVNDVITSAIYGQRTGAAYHQGSLQFLTNDSVGGGLLERMRIDSSGNVGVGTSSPSGTLDLGTTTGQKLQLYANNFDRYGLGVEGGEWRAYSPPSAIMTFGSVSASDGTTFSERMRIDSAGNVAIGRTDVNSFDIVGHGLRSDGVVSHTANSQAAVYINRETNDGDLVVFRKDNSTVGSIGTYGNTAFIQSGSGASYSGLLFNTSQVEPTRTLGGTGGDPRTDDGLSLGSPSYRFKDLYLSGGVYLGGTGSANKLDDYEEGTWTPTFAGLTIGNGTVSGTYTKIGRQVTVVFGFNCGSTTSVGTLGNITGLPFSSANIWTGYIKVHGVVFDSGSRWFETVAVLGNNSNTIFVPSITNYNSAVSASSPMTWTTNDNLVFTATYFTA